MSKGYKVVTALLVFIIIAIGTLLVLNEFEVIKLCKCSNSCPKCEEKKCEPKVENTGYSLTIAEGKTSLEKEYKVVWKSNGSVFVYYDDQEKEIASNVTKYYDFHLGASDMCLGNEYIVLESNKSINTALYLDDLSCGDKITLIDTLWEVGEYDHLLQKYSIYDISSPVDYYIYAFRDGQEVDVSQYFRKYFRN